MTYYNYTKNYEFTAFREADFGAGNIRVGSCFSVPAAATTCITVNDNDAFLAGDNNYCNEHSSDRSYQQASIENNGSEVGNNGRIYAENFFIVKDQDGNKYMMIEIEQEGTSGDYFTFYSGGPNYYGTPPAGSDLSVVYCGNVTGDYWLDFKCLDAGSKDAPTGSISGRVFCDLDCDGIDGTTVVEEGSNYTIEAEDMNRWHFNKAWADQASGDKIVKLDCAGGSGDLWTTFQGDSGTYNLKLFAQDENDGQSLIIVKVAGVEVGRINLDRDTDGRGSNNGRFSEFVLTDLMINQGDEITLWVDGDWGEYVRIDKFELEGVDTTTSTAEPGKAGVEVNLVDASGNVVETTTTDANGNYTFENVVDGDYTVQVAAPAGQEFTAQNVGGDDTIDSDVNAAGTSGVISLSGGNDVTDVDAGLKDAPANPGSLSGTYFCDDNRDGVDNAGDADVAGKTVTLLNADGSPATDIDGNLIASTTTDSNGNYSFGNLAAGNYKVMFEDSAADGKQFIGQTTGTADGSDVDPANGMTGTVSVTEGNNTPNVDAGVEEIPPVPGSLSGTYFCDDNNDGVDNAGDADVAGKTVTLLNADGSPATDIDGNLIASTTTDSNGNYSFGNLAAGNYKVMFEDSAADGKQFIGQTTGTADGSDVDPANGMTGTVSVTEGNNTPNVDAGVEEIPPVPGSLSGTYFCDDNNDGVDNAGDADVAGKTVTLLNADGSPATDIDGNLIASTTTDSNGNYSFGNLAAGNYKVMFEDSAADGKQFIGQTTGTADGSDVDPANGMTGSVSVTAGNNTPNVDAGVEEIPPVPGSLSGTYFCDDNNDGVDNAGDADVAGKTVTLLNADGSPATDIDGNLIASTTTDSNGNYSFGNLAAGNYKVMFEDSVGEGKQFIGQTTGTTDGSDVDPANGMTGTVSVTAGNNTPNVDAGVEEIPNEAPTPADDDAKICAMDAVAIDVAANDTDPENDALTVTEINGIAITEGGPAVDIDGVQVSLVAGELVFDGSAVHAGLLGGEEAIANYTYTVSDGNGNDASANVEVTFCGATDTLDKVKEIIPTSVQFQIIDENDPAPSSDAAWTMKVTDATGTLSGTFGSAYCLSIFDNALTGEFGTDINNAALIDANVYVATDDCLPTSIDFGGTGLNGQDATDNLDMINWIVNQSFTGQDNGDGTTSNYTDNEIQAAIWGLTDGLLFVSDDGHSTESNAQEIYDAAIANGEGFEANAANGGIVTVYFDPTGDNDPSADHVQPFIAAIDLFEDCIC